MGMLVNGVWHAEDPGVETKAGRFLRAETAFHNWITEDGAPGPSGEGGFAAEPGRYHLYVSLACPWAQRTLIFRELKKLEDAISLSVVDPLMGAEGWIFSDAEACIPDTANGFDRLHQVYGAAKADYTGRVTVPVLWDKRTETIVNNESSEIIRMFNRAFDRLAPAAGDPEVDFYPVGLRSQIDAINALVYENVNNGVYRCGFATTQEAYEGAFDALFAALDELEARLSRQRYLAGPRITEADWRLFTTLVRFDSVYHGHFKCNLRRLVDYANLWNYTRELYQVPGVSGTVNLSHIKRHYYASHTRINPSGLVPKGPALDFSAPHDRARLAKEGEVC
ncbi:MAG: glutathione S-transferase family protein [Alphaproteobacteria bacterium]